MSEQIEVAIGRTGPGIVLRARLTPQLVSDAQSFAWAEAGDPLCPVGVLRLAHRAPVAADEIANPARNHLDIVAPAERRG